MEVGTQASHQPLAPAQVDVHAEDGSIAVPGAGHVAAVRAPSTLNVRHGEQRPSPIALKRVVPPVIHILRPRDAVGTFSRLDEQVHQRAVRLEPVVDSRVAYVYV